MNFGQERFQWLEQDPYTREKMPFYMTYPMQNTVFEETEYEKDCKRLQEMYPREPEGFRAWWMRNVTGWNTKAA